jgi:hypothetical protein
VEEMQNDYEIIIEWTGLDQLLEVKIENPDSFLKIRETLCRIGVASKKEKILHPSCHILHKKGRYYIVHFKEMFALEGKTFDMSAEDLARRNTIAKLLEEWGLCKIISKHDLSTTNLSNIKIIPYKEKHLWTIKPKYAMLSDRTKRNK